MPPLPALSLRCCESLEQLPQDGPLLMLDIPSGSPCVFPWAPKLEDERGVKGVSIRSLMFITSWEYWAAQRATQGIPIQTQIPIPPNKTKHKEIVLFH